MRDSIWISEQPQLQTTTLQQDVTCDICIIGGGMTGIQTAYQLAKAGFHVILVEAKSAIGLGTTGMSTGKLTTQHGIKLSSLSLDNATHYYTSNQQAMTQFIQDLPKELYEQVTSFVYTTTEQGKHKLQREAERYQQLHIPFVATKETELPFPITCALGIHQQFQLNPLAVLHYSAQQALEAGATIYTDCRVTKILTNQIELENGHSIAYNKLFVCTHYPIASIQQLHSTQLSVYRAYLTASPITDTLSGQYMSIDSPSRTIRTTTIQNQSYLLYGGSNHRAGTTTDTNHYYKQLQAELHQHFDIEKPSYYWSAQDVQTPTSLPFIEAVSERIFIATGYDKWGLSNALVASQLLLHYAKGETHPAQQLFQTSWHPHTWQKILQTAGFISFSFIEGHLTRQDAPKCTHLGCKTNWNEGDGTWDCPCHGSRFAADGQVLEGPAVYPLAIKKARNPN